MEATDILYRVRDLGVSLEVHYKTPELLDVAVMRGEEEIGRIPNVVPSEVDVAKILLDIETICHAKR